MTGGADSTVVGSIVATELFMRVVAGQARQRSIAFLKALAFLKIRGLMADVPRIVPIGCSPIRAGEAVTASAESIQLSG